MFRFLNIIVSSFKMALEELRSNKLRTFLSLLGITFGIFCIISVLATIASMKIAVKDGLNSLGSKSVFIDKWEWRDDDNYPWWKYIKRPVPKYEELDERSADLKRGLIQNLREFYGILLETLSAAVGARRITWNYVAHTVLKQSGYGDEQINERYTAEKKAWIEEKERIAKLLEEGIKKMAPPQ